MSTAVLISGQLRTFARCYPTQRWHVLRHFDDPHFFITVQKPSEDPQVGYDILTPLMEDYGIDHVHLDYRTDPDLSEHLTPELTKAYHLAPYANAAPAHQLLLQHWYQNEVWRFHTSHPSHPSHSFDTIVRLRPDLWFHSFDTGPMGVFDNECYTPWWGRFGGINDRFAIMGPRAAAAYFTLWDRIPELLSEYHAPFHPETLLAAALEVADINVTTHLRTEFSTLRMDGSIRPPEIAPWDLAHAALRAA